MATPPPEDTAPKTAAEADAQNSIGRQHRWDVRGSYGGGSGQAASDYNTIQENEAANKQHNSSNSSSNRNSKHATNPAPATATHSAWQKKQNGEGMF